MAKKLKAYLCILTSLILVMTGICPVMADQANQNQQPGQQQITGMGRIGGQMGDSENFIWMSIVFSPESSELNFHDNEPLDGIAYDATTNTLSLTNFNYPAFQMMLTDLGADFKINLTGENKLKMLSSESTGGDCSITFTGDGTLSLNEEKTMPVGFAFSPARSASAVDVSGSAVVTSYAGEGTNMYNSPAALTVSEGKQDCIKANVEPALKVSQLVNLTTYDYITEVWDDPNQTGYAPVKAEVYTKESNPTELYTIEYSEQKADEEIRRNWMIHRVYQLPNAEKYIRIFDSNVDVEPTGFSSVSGNEIVSYSATCKSGTAYNKDNKIYVYEYDFTNELYRIYELEKFADRFFERDNNWRDLCMANATEITYNCPQNEIAKLEALLKADGYEPAGEMIDGIYNMSSTDVSITLQASVEQTHTHTPVLSEGYPATCGAVGSKDFYYCKECSKVFEDKACTKEISNVKEWSVIPATGHDFGENNATCKKCGEKNPNYKAPETGTQTPPSEDKKEPAKEEKPEEPVTIKKPTASEEGGKVTTTDKGEATVTEVKKTTKKSITVSSTATVDGVEYKVTTINANAFKNASKATTVTLPDTITKINASAFAKSKVKTVKLTVKKGGKLTVSKNAFKKSKVTKVQLTVSKKATSKEVSKLKKAFTKAGIKAKNIKVKKK